MTDSVKSAAEANSYAGGWELSRRATPLTFALTKLDIRAAFESGAAWQREQDESDVMKVAAQRAARIRELEADLDMARQEYHELEEFHRLYIHPYKQRAEQDEARLEKVREYAEAMVSNDMSGWDFMAKLVGDGAIHCARGVLAILDGEAE